MKYVRQEPPNAVQIELAEGCNLRCDFCGLSGIRSPKVNDFKFMKESTLRTLVSAMVAAQWNHRIEFAMHGEPTMHPTAAKMVGVVRELAPTWHVMMTSNGGGLLRAPGPAQNVTALFEAGLNVLALDDYENARIVPKIRTAWSAHLARLDASNTHSVVQTYEYPAQSDGNPHARTKPHERKLVFVQDIGRAVKGTHSHLNNHAGAGAPPNDRGEGKRCAKPFREMSVRWDGGVAVCCNDWRGIYRCGDVTRDSLDEIWNGPAMDAARRKLYLGERDFGPCRGCDATSHRVGLLPDKLGKQTMPRPTPKSAAAIGAALAEGPMTRPVLRPWEKQK